MIVFSDKTGMEIILFAVFAYDNFKLNRAAAGKTVIGAKSPLVIGIEDQPFTGALSDKSMSSRGVDTDIEVVFIHI